MICSQVTVDDGTTKKYDCVNGICIETANGQYNEPTCARVCKKKEDNTSLYIIGAAALLGAYLFFGDKK